MRGLLERSITSMMGDIAGRGTRGDPVADSTRQSKFCPRRSEGSDGVVYPSVRHAPGHCVAAFWPDAVGVPVQERHLQYEWNGAAMTRYFDYLRDGWFPLPKSE